MAAPPGQWSNGLCGCCGDCGACCCAFFCPPCQFHTSAARVGVACGCCLWFVPGLNYWCFAKVRGKVRDKRNIPGGCVGDCCVHCLCHCCALAQESQELDVAARQTVAAVTAQPITVHIVHANQVNPS